MLRVLVTGAGGPAAVAFMRAVAGDDLELHAGDMDPHAAGLYLVPATRRVVLPPGADRRFVDQVVTYCDEHAIDAFVPTVDWELEAVAKARDRFAACGTRVMVAKSDTLALALDKWVLLGACRDVCATPRSALFDSSFDPAAAIREWKTPLVVKPRRGAGGRGVHIVDTPSALPSIARDGSSLVQEYLPGDEYSVDVLSDLDARVLAAVPRSRLKITSGLAVAARTMHHPALEAAARAVAERLHITFVANMQFRCDGRGIPRLLEVNVRFPGTMPLTVASGVNMPRLALDLLLRRPLPADVGLFREVAMVRTWQEHFLEPDVFVRTGLTAVA